MTSLAVKYFLFISFNVFFAKNSCTWQSDTSKTWYKIYDDGLTGQVSNPEYADFYRLIITPDSAEADFIVEDYYKNGQPMFTGKYKRGLGFGINGRGTLEGSCISFFADGKTRSTVTYSNGEKAGIEHLYFPNGQLYAVCKYDEFGFSDHGPTYERKHYVDCYTSSGTSTCVKGNGQWTDYDQNFTSIISQGTIKKGRQDGDWKGTIRSGGDSIKYILTYKNGEFIGGTGFDKSGKACPFTREIEPASCRLGMVDYLSLIRSRINLPKDQNGKKMPLEDFTLSFVIETDGQLSHIEAIGSTDSAFNESLQSAVLKSGSWTPRKYLGIPFRTKITVPLKYNGSFSGEAYIKNVWYKETLRSF